MKDSIVYWLPRILVLGFAASLVLPAPDFVNGLDGGGQRVWLARLIWVLSVPAAFFTLLLVILFFQKRKRRDR